jgi:iron complex outermembrane receptor protein
MREGRASWGKVLDNGTDVLVSLSGLRARGEDRIFDYGSTGISGVAAGLDAESYQKFFASIARGPWSFNLIHGDRSKDDPTGGFRSDPLVAGQYQGDRYNLAQLQYKDAFVDDTLHVFGRLFAGNYRYRSTLSYSTLVTFPADGDWYGTEWRLISTAVTGHKLMVGIEAQDNAHTDQAVLDPANPNNNVSILKSGYRVGTYVQDEWRIAETLTATLGLRVDRNNVTGIKSNPRAALIWQATAATTLKVLAGRAHRAPNVYERDFSDALAQASNPVLKGESIDTMEIVADRRVGNDLTLRSSVYQWTMRDLITLGIDPVSGLAQYQSGETVKAHGLELSADKTWESGARLRGSVSLQDLAYISGAKLLNSPKVLGKLNLSAPLQLAGLRAGYELRYDSKRQSLDSSNLGGYAISNLSLNTVALAKGLGLSLGIYNLFDKRYEHPGADTNWQNALAQDGRSVRLKILYSF